jgi:hypothetical protein
MASTLSISGEPGDKGLPGKNGKDGTVALDGPFFDGT